MTIDESEFYEMLQLFKIKSGGQAAVQIISDTITLTAADLGKTFLVEGGPYTIILPAASAGINKFINFIFEPAVFGQLFTLSFPGGATITYGAGETISIFTDGVQWMITAQRFADQNYILGLSAPTSVPAGVVKWDTITDSVGGGINYDPTTGIIKPKYQGWYDNYMQLAFSADPGGCFMDTRLNSTAVAKTQTSDKLAIIAMSSVFCNGTTDSYTLEFTTTNAINVGTGGILQNYAMIRRRSVV